MPAGASSHLRIVTTVPVENKSMSLYILYQSQSSVRFLPQLYNDTLALTWARPINSVHEKITLWVYSIPLLYPIPYIKRQFDLLFNAPCINIIFNTSMLTFWKLDAIFLQCRPQCSHPFSMLLNNWNLIDCNDSCSRVSAKMHCIILLINLGLNKFCFLYFFKSN